MFMFLNVKIVDIVLIYILLNLVILPNSNILDHKLPKTLMNGSKIIGNKN